MTFTSQKCIQIRFAILKTFCPFCQTIFHLLWAHCSQSTPGFTNQQVAPLYRREHSTKATPEGAPAQRQECLLKRTVTAAATVRTECTTTWMDRVRDSNYEECGGGCWNRCTTGLPGERTFEWRCCFHCQVWRKNGGMMTSERKKREVSSETVVLTGTSTNTSLILI